MIQELGGYIFLGGKVLPMIAEACMRSGSNCGSLSLDIRFHNLLHQLQKENAINLDAPNLDEYMRAFAQFKLTYLGEGNGSEMVHFDCFDTSGNREETLSACQYISVPICRFVCL
jgi:hypothetical protein